MYDRQARRRHHLASSRMLSWTKIVNPLVKFVILPWVQAWNLLVQSDPPFQLCHLLIQGWVLTMQEQIALIGQDVNLHVARLTIVSVNTPCPLTTTTLKQECTKKSSSLNCKQKSAYMLQTKLAQTTLIFMQNLIQWTWLYLLFKIRFFVEKHTFQLSPCHNHLFYLQARETNPTKGQISRQETGKGKIWKGRAIWLQYRRYQSKLLNFDFVYPFVHHSQHDKVSLHFNSFHSVLSMHSLWT